MPKNKPIWYKDKPFGKPSGVIKVSLGDLVRVVYLPQHMNHFSIVTGVVSGKCKYTNQFFITRINKAGKEIPQSAEGWYSPENVEILVAGYKQTKISYKPLPTGIRV